MNTFELQQLKLAWLAAQEAGDTQAQLALLQDHPEEQNALIDFIAAYYATGGDDVVAEEQLLPITQKACQRALERVFERQVAFTNLAELRKDRNLQKVETAKGLRLSVDVWNKFEAGAIELVSLSQRQIEHLAHFFQVSVEQFATLLDNSQPATTIYRRQTSEAAHKERQGPQKQSFVEAIARSSSMTKEDKKFWSTL